MIKQIQVFEASADQITPQVQSFTKGFPSQDGTVQSKTAQNIGRALGTTSTPAHQPTAKARMPQELARILKEIAETNDPSKITTALQEVQNPQETITTLNQYLQAFLLIKPDYSKITKHEIELNINQTQYLLTIKIAYETYEKNSLSCPISITLQPIQERDQQRIAAQKAVQLRQQELTAAEYTLTIARANLQQAQEALARLTS